VGATIINELTDNDQATTPDRANIQTFPPVSERIDVATKPWPTLVPATRWVAYLLELISHANAFLLFLQRKRIQRPTTCIHFAFYATFDAWCRAPMPAL